LADGVFPSNEKRGYVLRRILRRAVRHYWLLGRREPALDRLVGLVADRMSGPYPELEVRRDHLERTTRAEEERFLSTIDEGMEHLEKAAPEGGSGTIPGAVVFKLKDTYGFPEDLTELIGSERGYDIDWRGFEEALAEQRARSREAVGIGIEGEEPGDRFPGLEVAEGGQEFVGYGRLAVETRVLAARTDDGETAFILAENPFYLESGGQVSDRGSVRGDGWTVCVERAWRNGQGYTAVAGPILEGEVPAVPGIVRAEVDPAWRPETERYHTATHLLHAALRERLGEHVQQAGSLVAPDRLRFDFSHRGPLTARERADVERRVNEEILANHPVTACQRPYEEAIEAGAMALFGEKYGDVVRVIEVPGVSLELCGGTHVRSTGQIGQFKIVQETGVAAGIRRIEAITGREAYERVLERERLVDELSARLRVPERELPARVERLLEERERLEREARGRRGEAAADIIARILADGGADRSRLVTGRIELPGGTDLGELGDLLRERLGSGAAVLHVAVPEEGREAFVSVVTDDLIGSGLKAGDLVRVSSQTTGSGGGGRAQFAQG
ncbi:MAG: alanine--tRNA ligase-related protein, partial [Gemmatimonadota bacterium]